MLRVLWYFFFLLVVNIHIYFVLFHFNSLLIIVLAYWLLAFILALTSTINSVGSGRRRHQLHPSRRVRLPLFNQCPGYDMKQSNGENPALEFWGMCSTPSLPLLPCPPWPGVVAPDRILSMSQIVQTMCANKWC